MSHSGHGSPVLRGEGTPTTTFTGMPPQYQSLPRSLASVEPLLPGTGDTGGSQAGLMLCLCVQGTVHVPRTAGTDVASLSQEQGPSLSLHAVLDNSQDQENGTVSFQKRPVQRTPCEPHWVILEASPCPSVSEEEAADLGTDCWQAGHVGSSPQWWLSQGTSGV